MHPAAACFRQKAFGLVIVCGLCCLPGTARAELWNTGYYPAYRQTYYPPSEIDFTALTHVIHFDIAPNADGTLNTNVNGMTPDRSTALVSAVHAAGKRVLICVAGSGPGGFMGATTNTHRAAFIGNLVNFVSVYGYDGIDIDWEPLAGSEVTQYTNFVRELRAALKALTPPRLLTVATAQQPAWFAALQTQLDQINLMTYGLSGAWAGWVTWFNAPIYDGGYRFPSTGGLVPSTDGMVNDFLDAGVAASKLGIGIAFYGKVWAGGAGTSTGGAALPRQTWTTAPTVTGMAYFDIMSTHYQTSLYRWDSAAQAAYLTLDNTGSASDKFISYDDEHACQAKVSYARNCELGGVMIWELGQGYRSTQPVGQRDPLLQAVKQGLIATPDFAGIQRSGQDIQLSFRSQPLALYRVQWATNLSSGVWFTLTNNVPGSGAVVQVTDRGALNSQTRRFYRVQTPP